MSDNTFKQNTFVLKEDGIYTDDGIQVSNEDEVSQALIDAYDLPYKSGPYTLNCRVDIATELFYTFRDQEQKWVQENEWNKDVDLPRRQVAHVTFPKDKPEQKRVTFDEQPEKKVYASDAGKPCECGSYIYSDLNAAHFVNCECGNPRPEENDYYNRKCKETEAAGQEQETAEAFLKAMKPQVADFDKHDKVAKVFDYYDMTGFAAQYASQQTASIQKQVEECAIQIDHYSNDLKIKVERIAQLEEALKEMMDQHQIRTNLEDDCELPGWAVRRINKALNPQDNQEKK